MSVYFPERTRPPDATFRSFVATHAAPPKRKPPLRRPGTGSGLPPELQAILNMLGGSSSYTPMSDEDIRAKATADAQAIIGPLLARQNSDYLARVKAGSSAIQGYTGAFADRVGALGPEVAQAFGGTGAVEGAVGNGLADAQGKANMAGVKDLAGALKLMGAPNPGGTVDTQKALSAQGTRVTKTLTADELARLANEGDAQGGYYGKQPGIAGLEGGQYLRDYLSQQGNSLASALADINQSIPGLVTSLTGDYRTRDAAAADRAANLGSNRATLAASLYNSLADRKQNADIFGVTQRDKEIAEINRYNIALANAKTARQRAQVIADHNRVMEGIAQQNADTSKTNATTAQTRAAKAGQGKPITWRSVVDDAKKTASGLSEVGVLGQKTRPAWQKAYNNLYRYLRAKYQRLTDAQVKTATINGLYGAGYAPAAPAAGTAGSGGAPTSRNPNGP